MTANPSSHQSIKTLAKREPSTVDASLFRSPVASAEADHRFTTGIRNEIDQTPNRNDDAMSLDHLFQRAVERTDRVGENWGARRKRGPLPSFEALRTFERAIASERIGD